MADEKTIEDGYSLDGLPVPSATMIDVGICASGESIGIDLCGTDEVPFAHCHFDPEAALRLAHDLVKYSIAVVDRMAREAGETRH